LPYKVAIKLIQKYNTRWSQCAQEKCK